VSTTCVGDEDTLRKLEMTKRHTAMFSRREDLLEGVVGGTEDTALWSRVSSTCCFFVGIDWFDVFLTAVAGAERSIPRLPVAWVAVPTDDDDPHDTTGVFTTGQVKYSVLLKASAITYVW
jgi:hypothetical protein